MTELNSTSELNHMNRNQLIDLITHYRTYIEQLEQFQTNVFAVSPNIDLDIEARMRNK
jgi:hypothetical protein